VRYIGSFWDVPESPRAFFQTFPGLLSTPGSARVESEIEAMKAVIYAQFNPVKTMRQLIGDRCALRLLILGALLVATCL
jgi:hypothetical protein